MVTSDLVKTIYLMTAIPIVFRSLLKNWQVGLGYEVPRPAGSSTGFKG